MRKFYPGWTMRVYYHVSDYDGDVMKNLCKLACAEPELDICDAKENPKLRNTTRLYPLLWRFLPVLDRQVDNFLSRDLDSRISEREVALQYLLTCFVNKIYSPERAMQHSLFHCFQVACVQEFLKSGKYFHVMRDHPAHGAPMLGGTWGTKVINQRKELIEAFKQLFKVKYMEHKNY